MAKFVTVKHVPLCKVGQWGASTGPVTLTPDVLMSMVEAENEIGRAVVKIGHRDPRFQNPVFDGEPAYGQVANLSEENGVLYGDLVNVPAELAESMKSAYPNRSVEIAWNLSLKNAAGQVRKTFKAALIGLALLGQTPPAVRGLSALSGSAGGYESTSVSMLGSMVLTDTAKEVQEALRDAGLGLYATTREDLNIVQLSEDELEFTSPSGTHRCKYELGADGVYEFSDTEAVTRDFPQPTLDIIDADGVSNSGGTSAEESSNSRKDGADMSDFAKRLREKLGLPEGATEEEIFAAANPAPAALSGAGAPPPAGDAPKNVVIPEATFMEMQTQLSATKEELTTLKTGLTKKDHDALVTSYLSEGRIHPTEEAYFRKQLERDEEGTIEFLSARTPVLPVSEVGSSFAPHTQVSEFKSDDEFNAALAEFGMTADQ